MKMLVSFLSALVLVSAVSSAVLADPPPVFNKKFVSWKEYHEGKSEAVRMVEVETTATNSCPGCATTMVSKSYQYNQPPIVGEPSYRTPAADWPGGANDFARNRAGTLARQFPGEYGCVPRMPCGDSPVSYGYGSRGGYGQYQGGYRPYRGYGYVHNNYGNPGVFYGRNWGTGRAVVHPVNTHLENRSIFGVQVQGGVYVRSHGRRYGY